MKNSRNDTSLLDAEFIGFSRIYSHKAKNSQKNSRILNKSQKKTLDFNANPKNSQNSAQNLQENSRILSLQNLQKNSQIFIQKTQENSQIFTQERRKNSRISSQESKTQNSQNFIKNSRKIPIFIAILSVFAFFSSPLTAAPKDNRPKNVRINASTGKRTQLNIPQLQFLKWQDPERRRGREELLGIMPSSLDEFSHSIYSANAVAISGARDTESALRYLPFVTIVNTAGFGNGFDIRSQGRNSSEGLRFYINGVPANPLDSYYGFLPMDTISPKLIYEMLVYPGSGAVTHGGGTRGGVVNIITSQRSEKPYFTGGASFASNIATRGNNYQAYIQAAENFKIAKLNAAASYYSKGGPRDDDYANAVQAVFGASIDLGGGQKLDFDADFYYGKIETSAYNSFFYDYNAMSNIMTSTYGSGTGGAHYDVNTNKAFQILNLPAFNPTKGDRQSKQDGEILTDNSRLSASIIYAARPLNEFEFSAKLFISLNNKDFNTYKTTTPFYAYKVGTNSVNVASSVVCAQNSSCYLPFAAIGNLSNSIDQSGSNFKENKVGLNFRGEYQHFGSIFGDGVVIFGLDAVYETSKRNPIQKLSAANLTYGGSTAGVGDQKIKLDVHLNTPLDLEKITTGIYAFERFAMSDLLNVALGIRYDFTSTQAESDGTISATRNQAMAIGGQDSWGTPTTYSRNISGKASTNNSHFAFEITPTYTFSPTGVYFFKYEYGFVNAPAYALLQRTGALDIIASGTPTNESVIAFDMTKTNLKDETYHSFEAGVKDYMANQDLYFYGFGVHLDAALVSASLYYTASSNEFAFTGDPYNGFAYTNYSNSSRMGVELAFEQYFYEGALGFNESFTYMRARAEEAGEWKQIPYTYDYKATLGVNAKLPSVAGIDPFLWLQNSIYGNQHALGASIAADGTAISRIEKLKPYTISDIGVSVNFNRKMATITAGVKNVLDTFYYDYYNHDATASIGEYRYLIGSGRTWFIEGKYTY